MQIAHGLAEHSSRYARFAQRLTDHGYAVYALRPPGARQDVRRARLFADAGRLADRHRRPPRRDREGPRGAAGLPVFLIGHSMGSFISRGYAAQYGSELAGLVLSGTAGGAGAIGKVGVFLASTQARAPRPRPRERADEHAELRAVQRGLQADPHRLRLALARPRRGRQVRQRPRLRVRLQRRRLRRPAQGSAEVNTDRSASRVPKDLPVHLASGDQDPVGANGKGVRQVADQLRRARRQDVTMTLWPEARHEILNETNRDEVEVEIVNWLDAHLVAAAA